MLLQLPATFPEVGDESDVTARISTLPTFWFGGKMAKTKTILSTSSTHQPPTLTI